MAKNMIDAQRTIRTTAGTAATWALAFAAIHLAWALGWQAGLPSDVSLRDDPRLLAVDLIAIPMCLVAMAAALRLSAGDRWARLVCAAAAAFAFLHSLPPLGAAVLRWLAGAPIAADERARYALFLYEPYWLTGGILFAAALVRSRR